MALNQSSVIFGVNLSIADFFAVILLLLTVATGKLYIPKGVMLFFTALSLLTLTTGTFITPLITDIHVSPTGVLADYAKLLTCFAYLIVGIHIARTQTTEAIYNAFTMAATGIGLVALLSSIPGVPHVEFLHYGMRFRGLLNDPNYFAVVQVIALALLVQATKPKQTHKIVGSIILVTSVFLSGSKTGAIALIVYAIWYLISTHVRNVRGKSSAHKVLFAAMLITCGGVLVALLADSTWRFELASQMEQIPALSRIAPLLVDFQAGISEGGSSRDDAWLTALTIISVSPLAGVGLGTYLQVAEAEAGTRVLAHNTFLQLYAEWGIIFASAFFFMIIFFILKRPQKADQVGLWGQSRNALIPILVGSIGISLNNARIFWLVLGILLATHFTKAAYTSLNESFENTSREK